MAAILLFGTCLLITVIAGFNGDLTYYDPSVGLTACGTQHSSSDNIAALSFAQFINTPNPNNSPSCRCAQESPRMANQPLFASKTNAPV
eukprot:IDg7029t1